MTKVDAKIRDYHKTQLDEKSCPAEPMQLFHAWLEDAIRTEPYEANAMTIATVNRAQRPTARIVLLKEITADGLIFFTNYHSAKAMDLQQNPDAALVFWWPETERQVRIEGIVQKTSAKVSETYFHMRPKESQIAAHASPQSQIIPDRVRLDKRYEELTKQYENESVLPCPEDWGGYLVRPDKFEFWQGGLHRMHDRICYNKQNNSWTFCRLAP